MDEDGNRIKNENGQWEFDAVPTTNWGRPETLDMWREAWADIVNARFEEKGLDCRIDHRSFVEQGLDLIPTVHEGPHVRKMEKKGIRTEKGELNRWIKATNRMIHSMRATIAALKEWIAEAKEILKEPQEVYLADLLRDSLRMRDTVAMTYVRGRTKAKHNNTKRFMEECNYLRQQGVQTLSDFENYLSSVEEKLEEGKSSINQKQQRLKELQQLMEDAKLYLDLKPVYDEMKKGKYCFAKAKEAYQAAHESELRRFYMVRRRLTEKGFIQQSFPLDAWKKEFAELSSERETEYQKYKQMKNECTTLFKIKSDIEQVIREIHPQLQKTEKETEQTL